MRSEDVAFSRLAAIGPSPAEKARLDEINRGIDASMAETIRDAKYNPNALDMPIIPVTPVGAVPANVPGEPWKPLAEPWRNSNPTHDFIRLGTTVASANIEAAEKALREAGEEEEPGK
jgi:hypothetical protein